MESGPMVVSEDGELVAVRRVDARDLAAATRLRATATRLTAARNDGVVELLGLGEAADPDGAPGATVLELRTRFAGTGTLATRRLPARHIGPLVADLATTLAGLHERGIAHGRLSPDHVVVAPDGRPVVCGLGDGRRADGSTATPADDVAALAALLDGLLDRLLDDDVGSAATVAALRGVCRDVTPATTASEVAAAVRRAT